MAKKKNEESKKASAKIDPIDGIVVAINKLSKRVADIEKCLDHNLKFKRQYDDG